MQPMNMQCSTQRPKGGNKAKGNKLCCGSSSTTRNEEHLANIHNEKQLDEDIDNPYMSVDKSHSNSGVGRRLTSRPIAKAVATGDSVDREGDT